MVKGDAGAESVFRWTGGEKGVDRRGAGPMDASVCENVEQLAGSSSLRALFQQRLLLSNRHILAFGITRRSEWPPALRPEGRRGKSVQE